MGAALILRVSNCPSPRCPGISMGVALILSLKLSKSKEYKDVPRISDVSMGVAFRLSKL